MIYQWLRHELRRKQVKQKAHSLARPLFEDGFPAVFCNHLGMKMVTQRPDAVSYGWMSSSISSSSALSISEHSCSGTSNKLAIFFAMYAARSLEGSHMRFTRQASDPFVMRLICCDDERQSCTVATSFTWSSRSRLPSQVHPGSLSQLFGRITTVRGRIHQPKSAINAESAKTMTWIEVGNPVDGWYLQSSQKPKMGMTSARTVNWIEGAITPRKTIQSPSWAR